ncbi:hypothetical protein LJC17_04485 [Acholeplasma sp. OttesenSCG-928-E16]|nr:hypothetical protein [Acholeplasma sp. OttesenSCG-928-E16]
MKNIIDFKEKVAHSLQFILLIVLVLVFVINSAISLSASTVGNFLATLAIAFVVVWLFIKGKNFTSYLLITVLMFGGALNTMFRALFGYSFYTNTHPYENYIAWDWIYIVFSLAALLYLLLMTISYASSVKKDFRTPELKEWLGIVIVGCYLFLFGSLGSAASLLIFAVFVLLFGDELSSLVVLLSLLIERPFSFFVELSDGSYEFSNSIYYWINNILVILLVVFIIVKIVFSVLSLTNKRLKKYEEIEQEPAE